MDGARGRPLPAWAADPSNATVRMIGKAEPFLGTAPAACSTSGDPSSPAAVKASLSVPWSQYGYANTRRAGVTKCSRSSVYVNIRTPRKWSRDRSSHRAATRDAATAPRARLVAGMGLRRPLHGCVRPGLPRADRLLDLPQPLPQAAGGRKHLRRPGQLPPGVRHAWNRRRPAVLVGLGPGRALPGRTGADHAGHRAARRQGDG